MPTLVFASIVLAAFASLIELPCTFGWPLIYTSILSGIVLESGIMYYLYLALYNLIYVIPLTVIIILFGWVFKGKEITKDQMKKIKLIGGIIMLALGIILLFNPELLMLV